MRAVKISEHTSLPVHQTAAVIELNYFCYLQNDSASKIFVNHLLLLLPCAGGVMDQASKLLTKYTGPTATQIRDKLQGTFKSFIFGHFVLMNEMRTTDVPSLHYMLTVSSDFRIREVADSVYWSIYEHTYLKLP